MLVLSQFVLRLSFGLALAMGLTSPRKVTSGFFRNHSYVLLGLSVVAALAAFADRSQLYIWPPIVGAALAYLCSAAWLYQTAKLGTSLLWGVAVVSLAGALLDLPIDTQAQAELAGTWLPALLWRLNPVTSGQLLGSTMAAMFLGHWYLNTPTMELAPLRKLLMLMAASVGVQAVLSGLALTLELQHAWLAPSQYPLLALRWLAGIIGTCVLTWMAWQTLRIPNTQSATGILYVAVITVFIGELASLLLSQSTAFPL